MNFFLVDKAELLREVQGDVGKNTEGLENWDLVQHWLLITSLASMCHI